MDCPGHDSSLCFRNYCDVIWNHSILDESIFISPWAASISALDLSYEVGTIAQFPKLDVRSGVKKMQFHRVTFSPIVEFLVGADLDWTMSPWPHNIEVSHKEAPVLCSLSRLRPPNTTFESTEGDEDADITSILAVHAAHHVAPEHVDIMNEPDMARDPAQDQDVEIQVNVETASESSWSSVQDIYGESDWHTTLIFSIGKDAISRILDWNDHQGMHQSIAAALEVDVVDLFVFHHVSVRPHDLHQAFVEPVIAHRIGDVPPGSSQQLILMDVEFHSSIPDLMPEVVRRVQLVAQHHSRERLLRQLGLLPFCMSVQHSCLLWLNNEIVPRSQDRIVFSHGDYLRVAIPPGTDRVDHVATRCLASAYYQGLSMEEILDRHALHSVGWLTELVEPPHVPLEIHSLLQLGSSVPSLDDCPQCLRKDQHRIHGQPVRSPYCARLEDDDPQGAPPPEWQVPTGTPVLPGGQPLPQPIQDLVMIRLHLLAGQDEEQAPNFVLFTWFLDQHHQPVCHDGRDVELPGTDPTIWLQRIEEAWQDMIDPALPVHVHIVRPLPHPTIHERQRKPHVILTQRTPVEHYANLVTMIDTDNHVQPLRHRAAFGPLLMNKAQIISVADLDRTCFPERSPLQCMIWHGDTEIRARLAIRNRHGLAFVIVINRVFVPPSQDPWEDEFEDAVFFQLGHQVISQKEGHVIGLIAGNPSLPLPTYVEILGPVTDHSLCQELRHWGHHGPAFLFGEHDKAVVFAPSFFDSDEGYHYILHNEDTTDENGAFLHSSPIPLSSLEIMQFLYKLDYWRAVVLKFECLNRNLFRIAFKNQCVQVQPSTLKSRPNTPWPELQPHGASGDGYYVMDQNAPTAQKPDHFIDFGLGDADFMNLFSSHHHVLSRDCTGMELPQVCQDVLGMCDDSIDFKEFDRLVIYCDGSSVNTHKYKSPLQAEEEGGGDTWAFLVLGERYDPPGLQCLGWTAQPTHYHHESPFHLGSDRVGADLAEKEALAWSALWRLSLNSKIPTCFRSDSQTSLGQAQGTLGCHANAELFAFLRGVFQALESFLPGEQLHLSHVAGHAGEGWNEMCDWLASEERRKSFLFPRPSLDMSAWKKAMPHLWMMLSTNDGLPPRHGPGLWVPPPELPGALENATVPDEALPQMHDQVSFNISFCTANVNSLHRAPDGHAGKVQYLRRQFKQLCLIFLGLQETRSPEFSSCVDGVLRLAGGCSGHQQGVELWVNLSQPYAHVGGAPVYFHREDFRVVVKSSRILLVRGDSAYWSGWILVGYAPHSGLSLDVKEAFWNDLKAAVAPCGPGDHIFALLDANASPGEYDGVCVFREGLASSSSTRFLRDFLETHELCLPCTSDVHVGELTSWVSPDGQRDHCIDFVAIPRTLQRRCTISQAVPELDLGHGDWDHIAMCVELSWEETHLRRKAQQAFTLPFDPSSIDKDKVKLILQDYQPMDWCADVESHVQQFNQHVLEGLSSHCPRDRDRPKKHYIDPKTWELRRMKLKLKKKLQGLRIRSRDENKIVFFKAWKNVLQLSSEPLEAERVWTYANSLLCHGLRLAADLRRTAMQLKMLLKNAKKNEIKEVFETMDPRASASHILHSIKPILGPTNLKKIKSGTLPFLKKSNGEPCTLPNEALEEWIAFFQNMEGGVSKSYGA